MNSSHYYINETGQLVMTEAYHLDRGYCCGCKCKHCPYNHENVAEANGDTSRSSAE